LNSILAPQQISLPGKGAIQIFIYFAFIQSLASNGEFALRMLRRITEYIIYEVLYRLILEIKESNLYVHKNLLTPERA
jgi:hypothetical protein